MKKVKRSLVWKPFTFSTLGVLRITEGTVRAYTVSRALTEPVYTLTNVLCGTTYSTRVTRGEGGRRTTYVCSCKHYEHWDQCCHGDALVNLIQKGEVK
jgi:hypothetical protein